MERGQMAPDGKGIFPLLVKTRNDFLVGNWNQIMSDNFETRLLKSPIPLLFKSN